MEGTSQSSDFKYFLVPISFKHTKVYILITYLKFAYFTFSWFLFILDIKSINNLMLKLLTVTTLPVSVTFGHKNEM